MSYLDLTIKEIHEALVSKKTTPLELTLEAIKRANEDSCNAFETIAAEEAIAFAKTLINPEIDNELWGVPFVAKDNISTKNIKTTGSSKILSDYVPVFDATVIKKLKERNAILIAKATLDELAMGGTGTTGHLGKTFNPYDSSHARMIGGSSSGSAASVAECVVPFSLGTDTGDSIRKPASFAGLVGMKPTWGRISRYGVFPFAPSLDHVGYFTRSVLDSAILLSALSGRDSNDSTSSMIQDSDYISEINKGVKGLKIAVIEEIINSISDKDVKNSFEVLLAKLIEQGALVEKVSIKKEILETLYPTYMIISCAEATSNNANLDGIRFGPRPEGKTYQEIMKKARTEGFGELIKRRFVIGSFALMRDNIELLFLNAQRNRRLIVNEINKILAKFDALIAPAAPSIAPKFDEFQSRLSNEYLIADNHLLLGNFAGLPSITIPMILKDNMPVGVNIMGRAFDEKTVFEIAQAIENNTGLFNLNAKKVSI